MRLSLMQLTRLSKLHFETGSYKTHEDHKNLYEALEKSMDRDHSDLVEARKKRQKRTDSPRTPFGSPPPPPPPPTGAFSAPAWTTSDTRYELATFTTTQETSPLDNLINDDSIPNKQVHLSDDQNNENDYLPKADMRKDWWKPLPEEERPATPEPAWTIPSSYVLDVENNWASALVSTYESPAENSLLAKTGDMMTFMNWYCQKVNKTMLTQGDFEGHAYEVVNAFYPIVIQLQIDVNRPLPFGGPPGHVTIQTQFFFNKDLEYLRYGNKESRPALSISKMKAPRYLNFGLELLVPEQMWIDEVCTYDISATYGISHCWFNRQKFYIERHDSLLHRREVRKHMQILSVIRIKAYSRYGDFEDLNLLLLQGHLDHLPSSDKRMLSTAVKLWTRNLVIRQRVEDFQLGIKSYQT
ncbi:hypothetical protein Tco_0550176 [Tanacetum coccineum]